MSGARDSEPEIAVAPDDPWMFMYTSGTTGNPKGAIRNHRGGAMLSLITDIELGVGREDGALLVMPMCHANSLYFFGAFAYCGATTTVYSRKSFDPEHCVRVLGDGLATFTSLVPTHYAMMLALPQATRSQLNLDRVAKLMISSAPARPEAKRAIMEMFPNAGLFELMARPRRAGPRCFIRTSSSTSSARLAANAWARRRSSFSTRTARKSPDGEIGELYASNPYIFDGYWKLPEKTKRGLPRRLLHGRRHGAPRSGWLHPSRRSEEQHDHHRGRERLSVRYRSGHRRPSRRFTTSS